VLRGCYGSPGSRPAATVGPSVLRSGATLRKILARRPQAARFRVGWSQDTGRRRRVERRPVNGLRSRLWPVRRTSRSCPRPRPRRRGYQ